MNTQRFIAGLRAYFDQNPSVKPSRVSLSAGMDNSTIRKILDGSSQNPSMRTAERISTGLGLTIAKIESYAADQPMQPGLYVQLQEEPVAYLPAQAATVPVDIMLARHLAPQVRRPMAYRVARPIPALLLDAGDTVIIDTDATSTATGLVVVNILTPDQTDAATQLRRAHRGILIATDPADPEPVITITSDGRCGVIGQIVASYRAT
jgi:hypothetical protein